MNSSTIQNVTGGLPPTKHPSTESITPQSFLAYVISGSFLVFLIVFLFYILLLILHCNSKYCGKRPQSLDSQVNTAVENIYTIDPTVNFRNASKKVSDESVGVSSSSPVVFLPIVASGSRDANLHDNYVNEHIYMELP